MARKLGESICHQLGLNPKDVYELHLDITTERYSGFALLYEGKMGQVYKNVEGHFTTLKIRLPLKRHSGGFTDNE